MKVWKIALGCLLAAAMCVPATAGAEQKLSLGVQFDYSSRDLSYVSFDVGGDNATAWRNAAQYGYDYKMTNHVLGASLRWEPCDWFAAEGLVGITDADYKQPYFGDDPNQDDVRLKVDFDNPLYGLTLEFNFPLNDSWALAAIGTGRFAYYRNCDVFNDKGMFEEMAEMDMQWWDVNVLAKVAYTGFDKVEVFLGPTMSLARLEIQKKIPLESGTTIDKLKLDEDKLWGLEGGLNINITDNLDARLDIKVINQTGASVRLAYVF